MDECGKRDDCFFAAFLPFRLLPETSTLAANLPCCVRPTGGQPDPVIITTLRRPGWACLGHAFIGRPRPVPGHPPVNLRGNVELRPDGTSGAFPEGAPERRLLMSLRSAFIFREGRSFCPRSARIAQMGRHFSPSPLDRRLALKPLAF